MQNFEVGDLLQQMHASVVGGCHFGINTTHKVSECYWREWWPKMTKPANGNSPLQFILQKKT